MLITVRAPDSEARDSEYGDPDFKASVSDLFAAGVVVGAYGGWRAWGLAAAASAMTFL